MKAAFHFPDPPNTMIQGLMAALRKSVPRRPIAGRSSASFLGLKYCDKTHWFVTIHTISILYSKMNHLKENEPFKKAINNKLF